MVTENLVIISTHKIKYVRVNSTASLSPIGSQARLWTFPPTLQHLRQYVN